MPPRDCWSPCGGYSVKVLSEIAQARASRRTWVWLSRQSLCELHDLLERRSILEWERRHGDRARADPAIHVKAARLSVFGACAVAVDLGRRRRQRFSERGLERLAAHARWIAR